MRIAYVSETFPPEINGVSLTAERTLAYLRGCGHQVQLVRPRQRHEPALDSADEWRTAGGPIPLYRALRFGWASVAEFRRRWRAPGAAPDLVHAVTPGPLGFAALRAARLEGIATSADYRTNFHAYSRHYRLGWIEGAVLGYLKRLHAMADCTFVPTAEQARQLHEAGFDRLQVVGRGVDTADFGPVWRDPWLRRSWRVQPQEPVLLHVGRLAAEKNVQLALDTYERLRQAQPALRMVVVGEGPLRRRLQAEHPTVRFVGAQRGTELARHYASADLFLFPSLTETFGNVVMEALASGLAVVAFDTAAAGQHIHHGLSGWLAAPGDDRAAREAFLASAQQALAHWHPRDPVRLQARQAALRAGWDGVLHGFEMRLRRLAGSAPRALEHDAALA